MDDGRNSRLKAFLQEVEEGVSQSQTEGAGKKKKPLKSSVKATVVSCERMQLYSILMKVASSTVVIKARTPHSPKC